MKNRLARLLKVLECLPRNGAPDVDALAIQLGTTPETIRRDLRDLREAGAFGDWKRPPTPANDVLPGSLAGSALQHAPANDGASPHPLALAEEDFVAMYVGARFLAAEGDALAADAARRVIEKIERVATPALLEKLTEIDVRYRFGPRSTERRIRQTVAQAIAERRVLSMTYQGENDSEPVARLVEPLAQFFIHDRWSFIAYCRTRGDFRQFRHERCQRVELANEYFTPRGGWTLDGFIERRREQMRGTSRPARRASSRTG